MWGRRILDYLGETLQLARRHHHFVPSAKPRPQTSTPIYRLDAALDRRDDVVRDWWRMSVESDPSEQAWQPADRRRLFVFDVVVYEQVAREEREVVVPALRAGRPDPRKV